MHWTRIENTAGEGVPDLSGCITPDVRDTILQMNNTDMHVVDQSKGRYMHSLHEYAGLEFWLELKVCPAKTFSGKNLWRERQIAWQTARSRAGGRVYNLVHRPQSSSFMLFAGCFLLPLVVEGPRAISQSHEFTDLSRLPEFIIRLENTPPEERRRAMTFEL